MGLTAINAQAREIAEEDIQLPTADGQPAFVKSQRDASHTYTIDNPNTPWAICSCQWAQQGNTCKHQCAVLLHLSAKSEFEVWPPRFYSPVLDLHICALSLSLWACL